MVKVHIDRKLQVSRSSKRSPVPSMSAQLADRIEADRERIRRILRPSPVSVDATNGAASLGPSEVRPPSQLAISEPGDALEREADRFADAVTSGGTASVTGSAPAATVHRRCSTCTAGGSCGTCGDEDSVRVARSAHSAATPGAAPGVIGDVLASPGQSLDAGMRAQLEPLLGRELRDVRVHTDARAAASASAVAADAYTVGRDVVFASGRYDPSSAAGQKLIAHELAHVAQQGGRPNLVQRAPSTGDPVSRAQAGGIDRQKWDPASEAKYRAEGQVELANAMRRCREEGDGTCNFVLTEKEALRWFHKSGEEPSFGTCPGGPGPATRGPSAPATGATVAGAAVAVRSAGAAKTATTVAQTVPKARHLQLLQGGLEAAEADAAAGAGLTEGVATVGATTTETVVGAGVASEVAVVAMPVLLIGGTVLTVKEAIEFDQFKRYIAEHYHIYVLEDPLGRCIQNCHSDSSPPPPRWHELPPGVLQPLEPEIPFGPVSPEELQRLSDYLTPPAPVPTPPQPHTWRFEPKRSTPAGRQTGGPVVPLAPTAGEKRRPGRGRQLDPTPVPDVAPYPDPDRRPRDRCSERNQGALFCDAESLARDEFARRALSRDRNFGSHLLGEGIHFRSFLGGQIDACGTAPGEIWHYPIAGTGAVLSFFGCLCCKEDGSSSHTWTAAHISAGQ